MGRHATKFWIIALLATSLAGCAPISARGRLSRSEREAIKATPLLERPDRLGHVYGNTVRWIYYGRRGHNGRL